MTWPKVVTKLAEIDLDDHAPKFKELGFDSMDAFDTSDKGALEKIADEVGLKPGHKAKFVKKFYEPTDVPPPAVAMAVAVPTPSVAVPIMPVEPPQQAKPLVPVAMPIVPVEPMSPAYTVVSLHKAEPSTRTGIALVRTANDKLKVESVGEGGVAHGLVAPGDVIIKINDMPAPKDHGEATGMLKALAGDIKLTLDKQANENVANAPEALMMERGASHLQNYTKGDWNQYFEHEWQRKEAKYLFGKGTEKWKAGGGLNCMDDQSACLYGICPCCMLSDAADMLKMGENGHLFKDADMFKCGGQVLSALGGVLNVLVCPEYASSGCYTTSLIKMTMAKYDLEYPRPCGSLEHDLCCSCLDCVPCNIVSSGALTSASWCGPCMICLVYRELKMRE